MCADPLFADTGPMYAKYNAVLRFNTGPSSYPQGEAPNFVQKQCETDYKLGVWQTTGDGGVQWESHNTYTTTIHALNSAIIKISKLSSAVPVFRGIAGASLPKSYFEPDAKGLCGGIEYGFSSTTTDRTVAKTYSKAEQAGKASTIIEASQGMADRGADISWCSQFTHEAEVSPPTQLLAPCGRHPMPPMPPPSTCHPRTTHTHATIRDATARPLLTQTLFPPLMAVDITSSRVDGGTLVVAARFALNMTSLTLEQHEARRKSLVSNMCDQTLAELRAELREGVHPDKMCSVSKIAPIEGNRYDHKKSGYCVSEEEYLKSTKGQSNFDGPIAPPSLAGRLSLAEEALRELLDKHPVQWFNDDRQYAGATSAPLMVKGTLMLSCDAPMLRLLGCKRLADRPSDVSLLELLQAVVPDYKDDYFEYNKWPTGLLGATQLNVFDDEEVEAEGLVLYTNPQIVWLGNQATRTTVPPHICTLLPKLEVINLEFCKSLTTLPELTGLTNLQKLSVYDCELLTALPELTTLVSLQTLDLTGCMALKAVPELTALTNLKTLLLTRCMSLEEMPELKGLTKLEKLEMYYMRIQSIPELLTLTSLKNLFIAACKISALPALTNNINLETLSLVQLYHVSAVPEFKHLSKLKNLDLDSTNITTLPELPTNLQELRLGSCDDLTSLPDASGLKELKVINLPARLKGWEKGGFQAFSL